MKRSEFLKNLLLSMTATCVLPQFSTQAQEIQTNIEYQINPYFVNSGSGFGKRIALTFDDGPSVGVTEKVLAELDKKKLKATFFMIGCKAERTPALAKEVADAGHEIANHTYTHPVLTTLTEEKVKHELEHAQEVITLATGKRPVWFRPPYGAFKRTQGSIPQNAGLGVAYWSVDPRDWARPGVSQIVGQIQRQSCPGSIVLMHDLHMQTAQAVGEVFDYVNDQGYHCCTMSEFLGQPYA
jgi:peptidoglycan-N-acetylglucosamine deacetylase